MLATKSIYRLTCIMTVLTAVGSIAGSCEQMPVTGNTTGGTWNPTTGLDIQEGAFRLIVPPDAAPSNTQLTMRLLSEAERLAGGIPSGMGFDFGVDFGPTGTTFQTPVQVTVTFATPAVVDTLPVLKHDPATDTWGFADTTAAVSADHMSATFSLTSFSGYQVPNPSVSDDGEPIGSGEIIAGSGGYAGQPFSTLPNPHAGDASLAFSPFGDVFGISITQLDATNPATGDNFALAVGMHSSSVTAVGNVRIGFVTPAGALSGPSLVTDFGPPKGITGVLILRKKAGMWIVDCYGAYEGGLVLGQATGDI